MIATSQEFDPFGLHSKTGGGQLEGSFDPFGLTHQPPARPHLSGRKAKEADRGGGALSLPPEVNRITRHGPSSPGNVSLPPKILVKLSIHEEVSSVALIKPDTEGSSEVSIEGSIYAQVQCSDAKRNAPFLIHPLLPAAENLTVRPDSKFAQSVRGSTKELLVSIPKQEIGFVRIAHYTLTEDVVHMPLLLERKITYHDSMCRIAVQVRSKLTNVGDLGDFTIAVAVPEHMDGESIEILRGDGVWDNLKRIIKWSLPSLNKGESFLVSAQGKFWKRNEGPAGDVRFPVLLRCSASSDQISSVDFEAIQADGHPASVTTNRSNAFRLLHRLK